ncbi:MAG: hypothetical protein ABR961_03160 [Thermoanaerobaculaceae bacterium]
MTSDEQFRILKQGLDQVAYRAHRTLQSAGTHVGPNREITSKEFDAVKNAVDQLCRGLQDLARSLNPSAG